MEIFPSIFLAKDLFGSLDWVSRPCKKEVGLSFKTQRDLCWAYPFSFLEHSCTKFSIAVALDIP